MTKNCPASLQSKVWAASAVVLAALAALGLHLSEGGLALAADAGTCNPTRPHAAGAFDRTISSGDLTREYILHIPTSYDGADAMAVVFSFHSFASNPPFQDTWSELPATAEAAGFVLVTPRGSENADGVPFWNASQLPIPAPNDVEFVGDLLSALESQLCIDPGLVFATGLSNGAFMSSRLACELSDRIAAIAPVAGARFFDDPSCLSQAVPVIAFHGTADPLVDFAPIEESVIPLWAAHNGCTSSTEQDPVPGTEGVRLLRHDSCTNGASVRLYVIFDADQVTPGDQGGGHTWPGSSFVISPGFQAIVGIATDEINANDLMWEFFMAHPLVPKPASVGGISVGSELAALPMETRGSALDDAPVLAVIATTLAVISIAVGGASRYAARRISIWCKQR